MSKYSLKGINGNTNLIIKYVCDCLKKENVSPFEYVYATYGKNYNEVVEISEKTLKELG